MKNPTLPGWITIAAGAALAGLLALEHQGLPQWATLTILAAIPALQYVAHLTAAPGDK